MEACDGAACASEKERAAEQREGKWGKCGSEAKSRWAWSWEIEKIDGGRGDLEIKKK